MRLILFVVCVFMGGLMFALPNMTRRELLFAVPVPPDFRDSRAGRHAIWLHRFVMVAVAVAAICALLLSPIRLLNATVTPVLLAIPLACGISFWWQHRKLAAAAIQFKRTREAELTAAPEKLPWFAWLAAGPFALLAAAAGWLFLHWDLIPARFPVHFNAVGQPNGWAERTTRGVYGVLFFGAEFCAWILIMALAGWFGSRRSRSRPVMLGGMIAVDYLIGLLFALIALQSLIGIPVWVIALSPMAILIPLIIVMANKMSEPGEEMDPTPNECWKGGILYYNANDAALFVEKRDGLGYTLNFANVWSWAVILSLVLVIASARFIVG